MAEGEVVYSTRADNSQLDGDLNQAEKKIDSKFSKIGSAAGKAAKATGAAFAAVGTAALAVGTKAVTGAVDLDKAMNQFAASTDMGKEALGDYEATMKRIYANNYGESFEDIGDVMTQLIEQIDIYGEMGQDEFQSLAESALTLRDVFDYDTGESIRAASTLMKQFGIDGDQAFNLIAHGAQYGLDFSDELLDSIDEYSVQFAKLGMSADDMFKIMEVGTQTGAFNLDKIGDAIKEMSIRVVDGSDTTTAGFKAIGLDAAKMSAAFAKGGESAKKAFNQTVQALAKMDDPLQQNIAGVNLFGTMWEDLGPEVVTALADIEDGAYASGDALEEMKAVKYDDLGSMLEGLGRTLETILIPLGENLIPLIQQIAEDIMPIVEDSLPLLAELIGELAESLLPVVETLLPPLLEFIEQLMPLLVQTLDEILPPILELIELLLPPLMELISTILPPLMKLIGGLIEPLAEILGAILPPLIEVVTELLAPIMELVEMLLPPLVNILKLVGEKFSALSPVIQTLASVLSGSNGAALKLINPMLEMLSSVLAGILDFITGVFTGDWEKAWNGIVDIFKGIINYIPSFIENVINSGISMVNGILKGINKLTGLIGIPEIPLIPKVELPRFHAGGIVDFEAGGEGLALLKDGEMVLTQAQQAQLFALAASGGSASSGQTVVVTSPIYLDGRLISRNVTQHQYTDVMVRRYK